MHEMDNTKRIITIIGLVFEFIAVLGIIFGIWFFDNFESIPGMQAELDAMSASEYEIMMWWFDLIIDVVYVMIVVMIIALFVNIVLFSKLMKGKFDDQQAKKVYLWQAIWGAINLLSNQITGVLYLISGVGGYNGHKEETDIRDGI